MTAKSPEDVLNEHRRIADWLRRVTQVLDKGGALQLNNCDDYGRGSFSVLVPQEVWFPQLRKMADECAAEVAELDAKLRAYLDTSKNA